MGPLFMILLVGFIYFIPSIYASWMKRRNAPAIFLLNLFLGWTIIGWIVACIWAEMKEPPTQLVVPMVICGQCGNQTSPSQFCSSCGAKFL